jgi:hypothetical protein
VLNREQSVQECDARKAQKAFLAGQIKISFLLADVNEKVIKNKFITPQLKTDKDV